MQNQAIRIFIFSSLAIIAMAAVWGIRQVPARGQLAERVLSESLDQELIVLSGAVKASTQALKYRLLDVLKAEGNDHATRTFDDSPFQAASLFEWDQTQWKTLWYSVKSKTDLQSSELKSWLPEWPMSKLAPDEVYVNRVATIQGQSYFVILVPVRRPNQIPMVGMGIFPAAQFGLTFSADENRDIRVFNSAGFALALSHPAYLGSSLKADPLVQEILERDDVGLRHEWTGDRGTRMLGVATRMNDSNLFAAIETRAQTTPAWPMWMYLIICAVGASALNWVLFNSVLRPLLNQLTQSEQAAENLRRQLVGQSVQVPTAARVRSGILAGGAKLSHLDFEETEAAASANINESSTKMVTKCDNPDVTVNAATSIERVIRAALGSLNPLIRDHGVEVTVAGLDDLNIEAEPLQLQTAIEEVIKNAVEAMGETDARTLHITGQKYDDRISLIVEDSGVGIPPADLDKVFDPFFSSKDSQGVARGLGLNVVRRVIEELSGKVHLSSRSGGDDRGTRVEISWPSGGEGSSRRLVEFSRLGQELDRLAEQITQPDPPLARAPQWPDVSIRKPVVRSLD